MNANLIEGHIRSAFTTLYPKANIIIRGAGDEIIQVTAQHGVEYLQTFICELDSDDDGFFRFYYVDPDTHLEDANVCVRIPYPKGM